MLIKIKNGIPTRELIPAFLQGLSAESLKDLSWTDPALGVSDCFWVPEKDISGILGEFDKYGEETLTYDAQEGVVIVNREVIPMTPEEIAQLNNSNISN